MPPGLCYNDDDLNGDDGDEDEDDDDDGVPHGEKSGSGMTPLEINSCGVDDSSNDNNKSIENRDGKNKIITAIRTYFRKYKGCGYEGPQPLCRKQTLFTFVGSFVTIYLINLFNLYITSSDEEIVDDSVFDYNSATDAEILNHILGKNNHSSVWPPLVMGPFGASVVLIFAMTTAAPSQPRNMLVGASIGMVVGKLVGYLQNFGVTLGFRMALATALTASIQAVTCTVYPPGGALALIFSSQLLGWFNFVLQVMGTALAIVMGVILNNLHPQRTYPTFWLGIGGSKETVFDKGGDCRSGP